MEDTRASQIIPIVLLYHLNFQSQYNVPMFFVVDCDYLATVQLECIEFLHCSLSTDVVPLFNARIDSRQSTMRISIARQSGCGHERVSLVVDPTPASIVHNTDHDDVALLSDDVKSELV